MSTKANLSAASLEDSQTKRESAIHPAEATAARPRTAADKDLVWRHWRATWLSSTSSSRT